MKMNKNYRIKRLVKNYLSSSLLNHSLSNNSLPNNSLSNKDNHRGFTLVTVLILSSLASILVLTSLKDNITQERLSGNYQKKISAQLASERGVFASYQIANEFSLANPELTDGDLLAQAMNISDGTDTLSGTNHKVVATYDDVTGVITLTSVGNRYEAKNRLKARFKLTKGGVVSAFENAVAGCDGVNLSGSGKVDSYDSSVGDGTYDESNPGTKGNVATINQDADVYLKGHSPVYGNVEATGRITLGGSSPVYGNLHANDTIDINQGDVKGNVLTRGNFKVAGSTIRGQVRVNGHTAEDTDGNIIFKGIILRNRDGSAQTNPDGSLKRSDYNVEMGQEAKIENLEKDSDGSLAGLAIIYGGTGNFDDTINNIRYAESQYKGSPNVAKVTEHDPHDIDSNNPATNCDHLGITEVVNKVDNGTSSLIPFLSDNDTNSYTANVNGLTLDDGNNTLVAGATNEEVLGKIDTPVIKLKSFHLKGLLNIDGGDVTIFVEGDFTMTGIAEIIIAKGKSLTLIVKGKIDINSKGITAKQHGLTDPNDPNSLPAMSIYSSYESASDDDPGIIIAGTSSVYAQIYAPLAVVKLSGSGHIFGAVRGKEVTVPGGTSIHYDAALGKADRGGDYSSTAKLELLDITY
jgi:cytoskeletal protein CcmA (bactofilin family)